VNWAAGRVANPEITVETVLEPGSASQKK